MIRKVLGVLCIIVWSAAAQAQTDMIPLDQITFVGPGGNPGAFPITTAITHVDLRLNGVESQFSKREGPNRWPDNTTPGWSGPLQYSLGMVVKVNGQWYASAPIETWFGNNVIGGPIQTDNQVKTNWFYDQRWAQLNGVQPPVGSQIGLFVVAGDSRNNFNPVTERSNIVLVTMPASGVAASFDFPAGTVPPVDPPQPPPPTTDLSALIARVASLEAALTSISARLDSVNGVVATLSDRLKELATENDAIIATFGNRITAAENNQTVQAFELVKERARTCSAAVNLFGMRIPISCKLSDVQ